MVSFKSKGWLNWPAVCAHISTIAVSLSMNSTWRVPRESFRYGCVQYLLVYSVALVLVTPATMLQLATGQLSQQDAVGVWGAVPFFTGIGYIKLFTSFLSSVLTIIYVALTTILCLYTLRYSIPFWECAEHMDGVIVNIVNASECLDLTFLSPMQERPEYFIAMLFIITLTWIIFPFYLYSPIKSMKMSFYTLGPGVIIIAMAIVSSVGMGDGVEQMIYNGDWMVFAEPYIWQSALSQALISSQLHGGYLVSAADAVYSSTNVIRASLVFTAANVLAGWLSIMFWLSVGSTEQNEINMFSVLTLVYRTSEQRMLHKTWPVLMFILLILSGVITLITLLYPLYNRYRSMMYHQWRIVAVFTSVFGAIISVVVLIGRHQAIGLLDEVAIPFLVNASVTVEIMAFLFIYGWRTLVVDIEFLTRHTLKLFWVIGWCFIPAVMVLFTSWWMISIYTDEEQLWQAITLSSDIVLSFVIFSILAGITVAGQVHFDFLLKIKSSLKPSRHWGPRDPIANYYWQTHRQETTTYSLPPTAYVGWRIGDVSGDSFLDISNNSIPQSLNTSFPEKPRANSDGLVWTTQRNEHLIQDKSDKERKRSKSIDLAQLYFAKTKLQSVLFLSPFDIHAPEKMLLTEPNNTRTIV